MKITARVFIRTSPEYVGVSCVCYLKMFKFMQSKMRSTLGKLLSCVPVC